MIRNQRNRFLSLALALCMVATMLPTQVFGANTTEISSQWAADAMEACHSYGSMNGDGDGDLAPDRIITRGEFAAMVNQTFGYDAMDVPELSGYTDVAADAWYLGDMATAIALEIITGYGNGIAAPEEHITREQAAVILARVLRLEPGSSAESSRCACASSRQAPQQL